MAEVKLDIGKEFSRGWNLFKDNMSVLIVAGLIGGLLSIVSCGVLSGAMTAGLLLIVKRLQQGDAVKPQPGDIFKGFDYFLQSFLFFLIFFLCSFVLNVFLRFIPFFGHIAGFVISLFAGAMIMWGILFVVFEKLTAIDALKKLIQGISSGSMIMPLVFGLLASLVGQAGALACFVGVIFTYPLAMCCMVFAYDTVSAASAAVPEGEQKM